MSCFQHLKGFSVLNSRPLRREQGSSWVAKLGAFLGLWMGGSLALAAQSSAVVEQQAFVEEILFKKTLLTNGSLVVRWNQKPTLSIVSGNPREREAMEKAVRDLERPLRPTGYPIDYLEAPEPDADIVVYHTRFSELPGLLQSLQLPSRFAEMDKAHAIMNEDGSLKKVYVFCDTRRATTEEALKRRALKLVLAAMGMPGESGAQFRSIFYEVPPFGMAEEVPHRLYPIDIRAIRLLYAYIDSGASLDSVRESFRKYWRRLR